MKELLGKKEIEALVNCKTAEFKKCIKCGTKYNIRTKEKIKWCSKCGRRLDFYVNELLGIDRPAMDNTQEILKCQWLEALGYWWPCKCWDEEDGLHESLDYYAHGKRFKNYRPLSTPLDYAPDWATEIKINSDGSFRYYSQCIDGNVPYYLNWPNCPKGMRGKIFAIPDDWRPK